jgi:hypothetical protein
VTTRRAEWDLLPEEDARVAWCEWFSWLGQDPGDVAVPGWVEVDDEKRQVRYLRVLRDRDGRVYLTGDGEGVAKEVAVVQFEARPPEPPAAALGS